VPVSFRLEKERGLLDWASRGEGAVDLTKEEAAVVAQAETAAALRSIADAIFAVVEEMRENRARGN
jgi:hypothetical protein